LRVTAFESVLYKRDTGKFDAVHVRKQYFFHLSSYFDSGKTKEERSQ
jgi:hypothetical protein